MFLGCEQHSSAADDSLLVSGFDRQDRGLIQAFVQPCLTFQNLTGRDESAELHTRNCPENPGRGSVGSGNLRGQGGCKLEVRVHQQSSREYGAAGKMVREQRRGHRYLESRTHPLPGFAARSVKRDGRKTAEGPRNCAWTAKQRKPIPDGLRVIKFIERDHGTYTMVQPDQWRAIGPRASAVSHCVGVHTLEFSGEFQHLPQADRRQKIDARGEASERSAFEIDGRHGCPRGELPNRFGDERGGKSVKPPRNGVAAADAYSRLDRADSVHEG